ncbi:MAG TPA: ABC transporter substrate-binding protein [Candidatus Limnocylindrales bacterium]|nr:ABC transporter substrate-binding protein [Candidatus Limnocylindrales bacterium]
MHEYGPARFGRIVAVLGLVAALLFPALGVAAAEGDEDPLVLRAGTDQDLQVLNPWNSVVVADFEVFTLNYDLLVGFGQDLEPVPGFAESWEPSDDNSTWTFKIRPGMLWSDGEPATSADVVYTFQLILDALETDTGYLGQGYLDGYLTNAGVTSVTAPDEETVVIETEFPNTLLLQAYVPILPEHVWSEYTLEEIGNFEGTEPFLNEPPVVGTGPYQAVEFEPGNFIRFARNENYWGERGAADEVIIQHFSSADTMVQALKTGEVDYVRGVLADQFTDLLDEPDIVAVEGIANGYTELSINTGGNNEGYGGRTAALSDVAFRDALGYAIDTEALVDATLGGYGTPGSTIIPPFHTRWHVPPENPRTFDIEEAKRRLDAAGYALNDQGQRLDKEGQPLNLRLTWPDSESENATNAEFLREWFGELGITIEAAVTEEGKLIDDVTGPPNGPADYDLYMWGWVGDPDPTSLLDFFRTEQIGGSSDSYYSNPRYDELFELQRAEPDPEQRLEYLTEMQELVYAEAPYHILYYDAELHAYRTDRFGGWTNQPSEGGTPLFGYGPFGYGKLTSLAEPSPEPTGAAPSGGASAAPTPAASGDGAPASGESSQLPLIAGILALVAIIAVGLVLVRRRAATPEEE